MSRVSSWFSNAGAALAVVAVVAACASSSSSRGAGEGCSADGDCGSGLKCLSLDVHSADGGCSQAAKACSKTCTGDADCASLGAKYKCFAGCGTTQTCAATP